jgi:hypothetical protein
MARRRIGQETLAFGSSDAGRRCSLDDLHDLIDWAPIDRRLASISCSAKGEPAWPPLALFKAMLLAMWYHLSDVKLAEALDDRASFRRYCGFSGDEATPERTTFVRFRKALIAQDLDKALFDEHRPERAGSLRSLEGSPARPAQTFRIWASFADGTRRAFGFCSKVRVIPPSDSPAITAWRCPGRVPFS